MDNKRIGFLTTGGLIAMAIALIAVGVSYAFSKNQMFSPGDLSGFSSGKLTGGISSHSDLTAECQDCHPAPWDSTNMADLCLDCHLDIQSELGDPHSLHGAAMSNLSSKDCRACHTDHQGKLSKITFYSGEEFPHNFVNFSLDSHQQIGWTRAITCQDCHPSSYRNFDTIQCRNCHLDYNPEYTNKHIQVYDRECTSCHDGIETINHNFNHFLASYQLYGKHQELPCEDCHEDAIDLSTFQGIPRTCLACHHGQDAHANNLGDFCEDCHTSAGWVPAIYDHTITGFLLDGGHANLSCQSCHPDPTFQELDPDCISCHQNDEPHQNQFGTDCTICHSTISWLDIHFDHTGPYAENCGLCHQEDRPEPHYNGQCSACHSISAWLPASFNHAVAQATDCLTCHSQDKPANHFSGQCSICHFTNRWKPANLNHTFPINHEGANGVCSRCHVSSNYYAYNCYQCHEHSQSEVRNEHEGVSNLENCIRCHWDGRKHEDGGDDDDDD